MTPYEVLGLSLIAVMVTVVLALMFTPRKRRHNEPMIEYGRDDGQSDVQPAIKRASLRDVPHGYRFPPAPRTFGKRPELAAPYGSQKKKPIFLTPKQIEHLNVIRRYRGKPPFNRAGLQNAISHPWDRWEERRPDTANDWLSYLILYEIIFDGHKGTTVGGCGGLVIDTDKPYNGGGGDYAGAGASGSWGDPVSRADATTIEIGASGFAVGGIVPGAAAAAADPLSDPASFKGSSDDAPAQSPVTDHRIGDPGPCAAPDTYSAPVSDSSSSYSSSSDSSSSSSSDSGSSGGGDSGGGGGGGD